MFYRIVDWDRFYENSRSRAVRDLHWVLVPNRHDGEGYATIMQDARSAEIFAAWILLIQVASKSRIRGSLVRDDGTPMPFAGIAQKTRSKLDWFEYAIPKLMEVGWIQQVTDDRQEGDGQVTGSRQASDGQPSGGCQAPDEERKKRMKGKNPPYPPGGGSPAEKPDSPDAAEPANAPVAAADSEKPPEMAVLPPPEVSTPSPPPSDAASATLDGKAGHPGGESHPPFDGGIARAGFLERIVRAYPLNGSWTEAVRVLAAHNLADTELADVYAKVQVFAARFKALPNARKRFCPGRVGFFEKRLWEDSPDLHPWVAPEDEDADDSPVDPQAAAREEEKRLVRQREIDAANASQDSAMREAMHRAQANYAWSQQDPATRGDKPYPKPHETDMYREF